MQVVDWFSTSRGALNTAVIIVVVVVTSLDQNIALKRFRRIAPMFQVTGTREREGERVR